MSMHTAWQVLFAAALLAGCGRDSVQRTAATERDSAGISIVENTGPYAEWRVAPEPEIRLGVVEGDSAYQFHRIAFAGRLSDGRIVVASAGTSDIRWYSAAGEYRARAGRSGEGPGEFRAIGHVVLTAADTLILHDVRNRRLTWVTPDETIGRGQPASALPSGVMTVLGQQPDGRVALAISAPTWDPHRPGVTYTRNTLSVVVLGEARVDTVVRLPGNETSIWASFDGGRPTRMQQFGLPFGHSVLAAALGSDIVLALSETQQLEFIDAGSSRRRIVRRLDLPVTLLTEQHRARRVQQTIDEARARGQANYSAAVDGINQQLDALPEGHTMPVFDRILVDAEGRLWLRDYVPPWGGEPMQTWTVYRPDGHIESRISVPSSIMVMHTGRGYVTGVARDSLDVEYVVVHAIERD